MFTSAYNTWLNKYSEVFVTVKVYKNLENVLTLYQYAVFSLSLSLLLGGVMQVGNLVFGLSVTVGGLIIYMLGVLMKFTVLLSLPLICRCREFNKLEWAKYSLIGSLLCLIVPMWFVALSPFFGETIHVSALYPIIAMSLFQMANMRFLLAK